MGADEFGLRTELQPGIRLRLCSIAARNYLPSMRLLAESFGRFHPDVSLTVLAVDGVDAGELADEPFEVLVPSALPIGADEFHMMATYYTVTELSTALKPTLIRHLLADADVVMYLDPDIEVFASLDELFDLARQHEIVLTPHVTRPMPRDGLEIPEEVITASGQFNLGHLAVSRDAVAFLDYWEERTRRFAIVDPANGYFTDQRWVDAVPTMFPHVVVRDPGYNVAYWNLHERELEVDADDVWTVNGEPLRFFHFSGHDDADPFVLTKYFQERNRIRLDAHPALRRLLRERADRMVASRADEVPVPYRWDRTARGTVIDPAARRAYWEGVRDAEHDGLRYPVHAFDRTNGRAFEEWLDEPCAPGSPVSRHALALWRARSDLRDAFPDPLGASGEAFAHWSLADPECPGVARRRARALARAHEVEPGVNVAGYLAGEFGVASAGRLMTRFVRRAGLPCATTTLAAPSYRHRERPVTTLEGAPFELSILAFNADELVRLWHDPVLAAHRQRARVGVWYWEVGVLPEWMREASGYVDEIWCASEYVRRCLEPWVGCEVVTHPVLVPEVVETSLIRDDLGLPDDRFLFAFVYDYSSVLERKNPLALVDAYRRAFGPDDGATLVLKTMHAERWPAAAARVREAAGGRDDIVFVDRILDPVEMQAFFQLVDCYVSLHRAEGFGLTIASAMAAGVPAIATAWSGNLEFMTDENSVLVPYDLVEVGPGASPYPADAVWAAPDLDAAAAAMRTVFDAPDAARTLADRARADLAELGRTTHTEWLMEHYERLTGTRIA